MTDDRPWTYRLGILCAIVVVAALAGVFVLTPRPRIQPEKPETAGTVQTGGAGEESELPPLEWTSGGRARMTRLRAEEVLRLEGKMRLKTAPDNEGETTSSGRPAEVQYVGVEDGACGKNEDPSLHRAHFELSVQEPGTYYSWARVWGKDSCGDSLAVALRREQGGELNRWELTQSTHGWWGWLRLSGPEGVALKKGRYGLVVENREDGARLSRIVFTSSGKHVPSGPEG